jgi:hypothetical protein
MDLDGCWWPEGGLPPRYGVNTVEEYDKGVHLLFAECCHMVLGSRCIRKERSAGTMLAMNQAVHILLCSRILSIDGIFDIFVRFKG